MSNKALVLSLSDHALKKASKDTSLLIGAGITAGIVGGVGGVAAGKAINRKLKKAEDSELKGVAPKKYK